MITRKQLIALSAFVLIGAVLILMGREDPSKKNKNDDQALLNKSTPVVNQKLAESSASTIQTADPSAVSSVAEAFPQRPGREVFLSRCTICHSLQSISDSPSLSREAWENVVTRMIKKHGADISSTEAKQIVDYLVMVKGVK